MGTVKGHIYGAAHRPKGSGLAAADDDDRRHMVWGHLDPSEKRDRRTLRLTLDRKAPTASRSSSTKFNAMSPRDRIVHDHGAVATYPILARMEAAMIVLMARSLYWPEFTKVENKGRDVTRMWLEATTGIAKDAVARINKPRR